jgi:3-deoxy-D-manno-octulosonate 8-phosphate phosphatase KdsC-like HAD superfamily phosphatase
MNAIEKEIKHLEELENRNRKLILIQDIMKLRNLMGYDPSATVFDKLWDMSLFDLCGLSVKMADEGFRFAKKLKPKTA